MLSRPAGGQSTANFLKEALAQVETVLERTAAEFETGRPSSETRGSQAMIGRWLVVLSRDHLADICVALVSLAARLHTQSAATAPMPRKADGPETVAEHRDDSPHFFLYDSLRKVLAAAAELEPSSAPLRCVPESVLSSCFGRLGLGHPVAVRHAASLCVGLLSTAQLSAAVDHFLAGLAKLSTDREQREWVPYQRAVGMLELSTHSAEQAASTLRYLEALAAAMPGTDRGVLRAEICSSLASALDRLVDPADARRKGEWSDFCAGEGGAALFWAAYASAFEAALKWAKKLAHAPFVYPLLVRMVSLAADPASAPGGAKFARGPRLGKIMSLLTAGLKKDALRPSCVRLAAAHITSFPADVVSEGLAQPSSSTGQTIRALVAALLPRRATTPQHEAPHTEALLRALGAAQPDGAYVLGLIRDALPPTSPYSNAQRALLLRVLAALCESCAAAVAPHHKELTALVRPILARKLGGTDEEGSNVLRATLLCLPYLWSTSAYPAEEADLGRITAILTCDERELSYAASLCLQLLGELQRARLSLPILTRLGRMLLTCEGSRPSQLLRCLSVTNFLTAAAVTALPSLLEPLPGEAASASEVASAAGGPTREAWHALRVTMQAAVISWVHHSLPEVVLAASALLASLDRPVMLRCLPPPEGSASLLASLPPRWGAERAASLAPDDRRSSVSSISSGVSIGGRSEEAHLASISRELERTLTEGYQCFFPSIGLAWSALWRQASAGPRMEYEEAAGPEGLKLWRCQLGFLTAYARCPLAPLSDAGLPVVAASASASSLSSAASTTSSAAAVTHPHHDPHTSTRAATDEDVDSCFLHLVSTLIDAPPPTTDAILSAMRLAHPSTLGLTARPTRRACRPPSHHLRHCTLVVPCAHALTPCGRCATSRRSFPPSPPHTTSAPSPPHWAPSSRCPTRSPPPSPPSSLRRTSTTRQGCSACSPTSAPSSTG